MLICLALCFFSGILVGQQPEQPIKTTLCQIKDAPMSFNKKLVEVAGYATHGFEDSMFEDPTCFESRRLPGIWMEYGGTVSTGTMFCCGSTLKRSKNQIIVQGVSIPLVQDSLFEKLDSLLHLESETHPESRVDISVHATVIARIFAVRSNIERKDMESGYGHEGCCMLLVIQQVKSVESTKPERSIFQMADDFEQSKKKNHSSQPRGDAVNK
jgi:hypothetical protein